ncbi:MAG: DedA family protein [Micrococcales bacterium]
MLQYLNPEYLFATFGQLFFIVACLMIFAETGLLAGFFLPGDSLLFALGLFIASGQIDVPLWLAVVLLAIAAFAGDQTGYWIGRKLGPAVFNKPKSKLFNPKNVDAAHNFFERYGSRAVILAHFVPIMRTFIPVSAGIAKLEWAKFTRYNVIGIAGWAVGVTLLGAALGSNVWVRANLELVLIAFVVISFIPIALEVLRNWKKR